MLTRPGRPRAALVARRVADYVDRAVLQAVGEQVDHLPCQRGLRAPLRVRSVGGDVPALGLPEAEQDRQADRAVKEHGPHDDPDRHPVVAPRRHRLLAVGGRVVMPEAAVDLAPAAV